jgi:ketosteroid isomerase-like protein
MNKATVTRYMEAFRATDRAAILACLTDDVVWRIPGFFESSGRAEFANHIVDEGFTGKPEISVSRLTEENDVVVAEGTVRARKTDGTVLDLAFCDVFEMRDAKIAGLTSYLVTL